MQYPTHVVEIFDNPIDFVETINKRDFNRYAKTHNRRSSAREGESCVKFSGTYTYEEANNLFYSGVDTNIKRLDKEISLNLNDYEQTKRNNRKFDYVGGGYSLGRYLANSPACMIRQTKVKREKPTTTIIYNCGIDFSTTTEEAIKVNSILLSAIKIIEQKGIKVNLYVVSASILASQKAAVLVKVKDAKTPINLQTMSYILTHPSYHRRHFFRWKETKSDIKKLPSNYGYTIISNNMVKEMLPQHKESKFISFYDIEEMNLEQTINALCDNA